MPKETDHKTKQIRRALTLDTEKYQCMLDSPDTTITQREEMIEALWFIITAFVDLGFDIQDAQNPCGQAENSGKPSSALPANVLEWDKELAPHFQETTAKKAQEGARNE